MSGFEDFMIHEQVKANQRMNTLEDERNKLRAEIDRLRAENERLRHFNQRLVDMMKPFLEAGTVIEELRAAIAHTGEHKP